MKRTAPLFLLFSILALSACGSGMTISSDWNDAVDFTNWSTFRYAHSDEVNPADALQTNPFAGKRVKEAIERNLQSKGFKVDETGEPDFVVLAHAGVKEKMSVTNWGASYGGYYGGWYDPWWGPYGGNTTVSYYDEGTLVIDVVDMSDKELAWRGMATATLESNPSADKMTKNINKAVDNILTRFPPSAQK